MILYDVTIPDFQHVRSSVSVWQYLCPLVPGDVLLATAFLSYSGPFNQEFRNLLLSDWQCELKQRRIPFGDKLNLTELLIDAPTISEWNLQVSVFFLATAADQIQCCRAEWKRWDSVKLQYWWFSCENFILLLPGCIGYLIINDLHSLQITLMHELNQGSN